MMDKRNYPASAAVLAAVALLSAGQGIAQAGIIASSTFDSGLDGWTSNTPSEIYFAGTGGNPGGFLGYQDMSSIHTTVSAPAAFLGNYLAEGVTSISYDHDIITETNVTGYLPYEVTLYDGSGSATYNQGLPSASDYGKWITLSAPIDPALTGWTLNGTTATDLLSNVTGMTIVMEVVVNDQVPGWADFEGIDNVTLNGGGSPVPEPSSLALLAAGFLALYLVVRRLGIHPRGI
jgi:PEP-CTERM motif